jgi:peptide/nickel transport system substrate-binding protein
VLFGSAVPANTYLPLMAGHDDSVPGYPFNVDKAKELMAASSSKDGFKAELLVGSGDPVSDQIAQIVVSQMKAIGGEVKITTLEPGAKRERTRVKRDFDWSINYFTTDIIDPDQLTTFAVQSYGRTKALDTQYKNPEVDALIVEAAKEPDWDTRVGIYAKIQQMHSDDAPIIFLVYPRGGVVTSSNVQNFRVLPTGNYRLWETWKNA